MFKIPASTPPKKAAYAIMRKNEADIPQATDDNMLHVHGMLGN
jgi:hypothetical protein